MSLLPKQRLRRDTRGAVHVEFLVAFLPVFVFFLCLVQVALLFAARLMVDHSAVNGARAAAVVLGDNPETYEGEPMNTLGKHRRRAVRDAVILTLAPLVLDGSVDGLKVTFPTTSGGEDQPMDAPIEPMTLRGAKMVRVQVEADVLCKIALANAIACTGFQSWVSSRLTFGRRVTMTSEAIFPYQGARYDYEDDAAGGGDDD
jgi:hypothetical protein